MTGCLRPGPLFSTVGQGPDALDLGVGSGRVGGLRHASVWLPGGGGGLGGGGEQRRTANSVMAG